jgi:hypothetical protein
MHGDRHEAREGRMLVQPISVRESPGRRATRPAMARPMPTDSVTRARATMPDARPASHHP